MKLNANTFEEAIAEAIEREYFETGEDCPYINVGHEHTHGDTHFYEVGLANKIFSVAVQVKEVK